MSQSILAIHGAFSTPKIFNYLKREFRTLDWNFLDYKDTVSDINRLIARAAGEYSQHTPCHVVGHSMGGLVGLALAHQPWVRSVTTIATPLGGLDVNLFQSYFSRSTFFTEISSYSDFISSLHRQSYPTPIQHIITTEGFNVEANHSEVMLHPSTVEILKSFWAQ